jgi:hypothetical protein
MCRSFGYSGPGSRHHWRGHRHGHLFGLDTEKMGPRAQVVTSLAVLAPVALSGTFLVAFVPSLWWIFTTYFWVAFPALGLLTSGISGLGEDSPVRVAEEERERELLEAIRENGEISAAAAAARTSLTVAEADRRLRELAENGHIEVRARGGAVFYTLWGTGEEVP